MNKRGLQIRKKALKKALEKNKAEVSEKQRKGNAINKEIGEIDKKLNRGNLHVSDHAVLRYMERVKGVNIDDIRDEIIDCIPCIDHTEDIKDKSVFKGPHKLVIKDNTVVTVSPK